MDENVIRAMNVIIGKLEERILQLQETLADGRAADFGEYQKVCGEVKGLFSARNYIADLKHNMENSDE